MGFGAARGAIGRAFVDIRPRLDSFGVNLKTGINTSLTQAEDSINTRLGRGIVSAVVGASVTSTNILRDGLREVVSLGADIGDVNNQIAGYTEDVQALGLEFGTLTNESVPALYNALSAGVPRNGVAEFLEEAQQAAIAGVSNLESSVAVLSASVNTFVTEGLTAGEASDLLFTAVQGGVTTFDELSASIGVAGPAAAAAGVEFRELTSGIATLTLAGIGTSEAATQLRALFNELQTSSTQVAQRFATLTGESFRDFTARGGDVVDALEILNTSAGEAGLAIGDLFGSVEASTAATVLAQENFAQFDAQLTAAAGSAGATSAAYEILSDSLTTSLNQIRVFGQVARQNFGDEFLPVAEDAAAAAVELLPHILELTDAFGGGLGTVIRGVAIPAIQLLTPPLELLAAIVSAMPEEVFAAATAYRLLFRTFTASAAVGLTQRGLSAVSGGLISISQSAPLASAATATFTARVGAAGVAAGTAAGSVAAFGGALTRIGSTIPVVGAVAAIALPFLLSIRDRSREATERLELFTDAVEKAGGGSVQNSIDVIQEIAEALSEVSDEAVDAEEAIEGAIGQGISALLGDQLNTDTLDAVSASFDDLVQLVRDGKVAIDEFDIAQSFVADGGIDQTLRNFRDGSDELGNSIGPLTISILEFAQAANLTDNQASDLIDGLAKAATAFESFAEDEVAAAQSALLGLDDSLIDVDLALRQYAIAQNTAADESVDWISALEFVRDALDPNVDAIGSYVSSLNNIPGAASAAESANGSFGRSFINVTRPVGDLVDLLDDLAGSYREQFDIASELEDANEAIAEGYRDLAEQAAAVAEGQDAAEQAGLANLDVQTQAGRDARQAIQDQATAILDLIDLRAEDGASLDEQNVLLDLQREALLNSAEAAGISRDAAEEYLSVILEFPDDVTIQFFADDQGLQAWLDQVNALPEQARYTIIADVEMSQDYLNFLQQTGGSFAIPGGVPGGADGAIVRGSSTGSLWRVGETGDDEVIINPTGSSLERQFELARDSGLLGNLLEYMTADAGAGATRAGGGPGVVHQHFTSARFDEILLAQFSREMLKDLLAGTGVGT